MATRQLRDSLRTLVHWARGSVDDVPGQCYILDLPPEILQIITEYVTVRDIVSLSRTCRTFHSLINDDHFWIHRIRARFPAPVAQLYTFDLFQAPELIDIDTEPCPTGFRHVRQDGELDRVALHSARYYNDDAIVKRQAKMYVSREDFLRRVEYFQFEKPRQVSNVPLMKLIYFYLIDRKRTAAVNMDVVHRGTQYLIETADKDSFTGRIIELRHVCWLELTGRLKKGLMPGRYNVSWRMKFCSGHVYLGGDTEFLVVPSHGKLCNCKISADDFQTYHLEHAQQWFQANMGQIDIYEPSTVYVAIRNWSNSSWKSGVAWDCIELTPVS